MKNIIKALFVLLTVFFMNIIAYFAAFALTVLTGSVNVEDAQTATVNQGFFNIIRYTLILFLLGWWYLRRFDILSDIKERSLEAVHFLIKPINLFLFLLLGISIQIGTDAVLYLLRGIMRNIFTDYDSIINSFSKSTSILFIITAVTLGPIVEELVFRGLIMNYLLLMRGIDPKEISFNEKITNPIFTAVFLQAVFFGVYHGNIIQGVYAFIFGILLGLIKIKSGSLIPSTFLHMIINMSLFFIPSGLFEKTITSLVLSVIFLTLIVVSFILIIKAYGRYAVKASAAK